MSADELNCDGEVEEVVSDIVSDSCFEPTYKQDSRKWIFDDGKSKRLPPVISTFKDTYKVPVAASTSPLLGRRTKILIDKLKKEATDEVTGRVNESPPVEPYVSSYDDHYRSYYKDFIPRPPKRLPELYHKYPLYNSQGMSYWRFLHEKNFGKKVFIPGLTPIRDIDNPFRKHMGFSKPFEEQEGEFH